MKFQHRLVAITIAWCVSAVGGRMPMAQASVAVNPLSLQSSSFIGGGSGDGATAIVADANGNMYVAGVTTSRDFAQPVQLPAEEAWLFPRYFLIKLDRDGAIRCSR